MPYVNKCNEEVPNGFYILGNKINLFNSFFYCKTSQTTTLQYCYNKIKIKLKYKCFLIIYRCYYFLFA